ncbi:MAG: MauE/DoxX family redox-associated membrane protein [Flavisolibacter sp.]
MKIPTAPIAASALTLIFSYTAFSKLFSYATFRMVLGQAPLLKTGAAVTAVMLPLTELFIVLLLIFPATRLQGLYASLVLLSVFTVYLVYMVLFVPHLPCSCGGVISKMSWRQHIVFNGVFIVVAVWGIRSFEGRGGGLGLRV